MLLPLLLFGMSGCGDRPPRRYRLQNGQIVECQRLGIGSADLGLYGCVDGIERRGVTNLEVLPR